MDSFVGKIVFITGASSGIGKTIAEHLVKQGYRVYGTSRKPKEENTVIQEGPAGGFLKLVKLDVCSNTSVEAAVQHVLDEEGRIDVLVNNAGFPIAGAIEETSVEEALSQFDTNFFGVHRMCKSVVPVMRRQGKGLIINIGSVMGLIALPFQSMYSASKYAIEAYTESLRIEVKPYGIRAVVIEPGDTKTDFTDHRHFCLESRESSYERYKKSIDKMIHDEQHGPGPDEIARIVARLIKSKNPPVRVTVGLTYKVFALLKRLLPARLVEYILERMY